MNPSDLGRLSNEINPFLQRAAKSAEGEETPTKILRRSEINANPARVDKSTPSTKGMLSEFLADKVGLGKPEQIKNAIDISIISNLKVAFNQIQKKSVE